MSDCLFCNIIKGVVPSEKVYEDDFVYGFKDIQPKAPVHILLIPKKHIDTIDHMELDDSVLIGRLFWAAKQVAADNGLDESGYRVTMNCGEGGGQIIFHIHLHLMGGWS